MTPRSPQPKRFSILLPVRNGGEHLKLCVASILAQTRADDFELLILENASTDGTTEWLAALQDARVRVYPAERPLSIEENWARILQIPRREFMTMIGHDDLLRPDFLETVSRLIHEHPDAGLYQTHFQLIDSQGAFLRHGQHMPARETAAEFVAARLCGLRDSFGTGHVLRSTAYDALGGIPPFPKLLYADDSLFAQAIGHSYRATALEEGFSYRLHPVSTSGACSPREIFMAFEQYANVLWTLQRDDPAMQKVLHRYFALHAAQLGHGWLWHERLLAYQQQRTVDPKVSARFWELVRLFDRDYQPSKETFGSRLLEKATRSTVHRCLFQVAFPLQQLRRRAQTFVTEALHNKTF